jgi:[DsrC]-trisulfide reductase subunit J
MIRAVAAILAALLAAAAHADAPKIRIERGTACVLPTAEIRRDHMKVLLHQRDLTMHQGIREPRFSLKNCVDCHASRATGSVLGKDGFCSSCHTYAAVSIDCFECHSPERRAQAAARP